MRNITSQKKNNLNSYTNNDGDDSEDEEEETVEINGEKDVVRGVQKELEHEEDRCLEGKKILSLVEPANIRRVIFCSGKVLPFSLTHTKTHTHIHTHTHRH